MNNQHISTEEIKKDIDDTKAEITQMEREIIAYEMLGDKMSMLRADARRSGVRERRKFIQKLVQILLERDLPPK